MFNRSLATKVQHGLVPSDIVQIIGAERRVVVNGGVHCMSGVWAGIVVSLHHCIVHPEFTSALEKGYL